ncbi:GNAT family N-acetyltransferase [Sandarakinorhabdus sp.]|uniref:GNAT family N-acetyltransferase n=1 Tax=Sandarakinorhabdus sp. TaxID=1916663 RepID=UPI003342432A
MLMIAPADAATLPACLALLPATADPGAQHWAALIDGEIAGAGAMQWRGQNTPPGFGVTVFVRDGARRRGVGRALLAAMAAAADGETDGLWSADRYRDDAPAAAFLVRCGFVAGQRDVHSRIPLQGMQTQIEAIVARLEKTRRIPTGVATPTLRDAPLERTAMLIAAGFGQQPAQVLARLQRSLVDPFAVRLNPDVSTVIVEDGAVVGVLLAATTGDTASIDCNIVAPHRRRSYVNALQLYVASRRAAPLVTWIDYYSDSRVADTMNVAARGGGDIRFSEARYWRGLDGQAATAA